MELAYFSADGEMGFPGNLTVTVRYSLNNDNELRIDYSAVTDKDTVVNLTNTTHFNLAGVGHGTVLDQVAMINADRFTAAEGSIPTGELQDVKGTAFDFTKPMAIGARIHTVGGYDLNWVLNNPGDLSALAVRVFRAVENVHYPNQGFRYIPATFWTDRLRQGWPDLRALGRLYA